MATRVPGGGITRNPFGPQWVSGQPEAGSVGEQVQDSLFGRPKPQALDPDPETAPLLARLQGYRKKLARMVGDEEDEYSLQLAAGTIASIDANGVIYIGRSFLLTYAELLDLQVGALAHEIGHRPKRWEAYRTERPLSREEAEELCRLEETRADYFAGYALAQLKMRYEPMCQFLAAIEEHPHPEYFPAELRADTIKEAFLAGQRKIKNMKKFFPELARMRSAGGDLGQG